MKNRSLAILTVFLEKKWNVVPNLEIVPVLSFCEILVLEFQYL
jgi:hypothetical protein